MFNRIIIDNLNIFRCSNKNGSPWCYVGNAGTDQWRPCRPDNYVP